MEIEFKIMCECGHKWSEHKRATNEAFACSHIGCGCRNMVYPLYTLQPHAQSHAIHEEEVQVNLAG
jgi:hypothetical protein